MYAFAGNPIRSHRTPKPNDPLSPISSLQTLKSLLLQLNNNKNKNITPQDLDDDDDDDHGPPFFKVLPFRKGRPLSSSTSIESNSTHAWHLAWFTFVDFYRHITDNSSDISLSEDSFVYLGCRVEDDVVYWAVDVSEDEGLVNHFGKSQFCFVELRTLRVATDWTDSAAMGELAIAGYGRALLEWHSVSRYCGHCGEKTVPMEAGRRKQCLAESCQKMIYPRVDPVVIMLVIDKERDRVLLSRQSKFVPRMWSCIAGFIEPGESLEEAVRRETWEETGVEVGDVVYHSSQPWPVGSSSMPGQLMVGFFAYAKSLEISVDKEELEDAQWYGRDEVKEALTFAEYRKAQMTAADRVEQMCKGVAKLHNLTADFNVELGELATMFVPAPTAIAHHLISSWVYQDGEHPHSAAS